MELRPIYFPEPLLEGVIIERKMQFLILVNLNGETVPCHCPTSWSIGNLNLAGRPCLLSRSKDPARKTKFTVEAVSTCRPEDPGKTWIGINQTAANQYVEFYLEQGGFRDLVGDNVKIRRARLSGKANLDFVVGNISLAVTVPLVDLSLDIPEEMRMEVVKPLALAERYLTRSAKLRYSLPGNKRTVLLAVYLCDQPDYRLVEACGEDPRLREKREVTEKLLSMGIEIWQANFNINQEAVCLSRCWQLHTRESIITDTSGFSTFYSGIRSF